MKKLIFLSIFLILVSSSVVFADDASNLDDAMIENVDSLIVDDYYFVGEDVAVEDSHLDPDYVPHFDLSNLVSSPTIDSHDLVKYYRNASAFEATFYDSNGNVLTNYQVRFDVNGKTYYKTTDNYGVARQNIELRQGTYEMTSYNLYDGSFQQNIITVLPTIIGSDLVKYYRNGSQFTVTVLNGQGAPRSGASVSFNINGVIYNRVSDSAGKATLNIDLYPNNYIITTLSDDMCNVSNNIRVLTTLITTSDEAVLRYDYYKVKVLDGQGNPLSGATVSFNVNTRTYNRISDSDGYARLNIGLYINSYIITSTFNGYGVGINMIVYNPMTYSNNREIIPISSCIEKNGIYKVKLVEDNKLPISDAPITITVNSQTFNTFTNDQGVAEFKLNLNPGTYSVTSSYDGNSVVKSLTVVAQSNNPETNIVPLNYALWNNGQLKVKLINMNTGAGIPNKNIKITINGVDYTVNTNNAGIASLNVPTLNSGVYSALLNYAGTDYKPSSNYTVYYIGNHNYDSYYNIIPNGNYIITEQDWINPDNFLNNIGINPSLRIDTVNNDYVIKLSNHLNRYDNKLENVISMNSYVASINYGSYLGHQKSTVDTISSFSGNCVDETNVFVSLARINNLSARYVILNSSTDGAGHDIGQVLVDGIWITVDPSLNNQDGTKKPEDRGLGNKGGLLNNYIFSDVAIIRYGIVSIISKPFSLYY